MATYVNKTRKLKIVKFDDGSNAFMISGQKLTTTKKVKELPTGVEEVKSTKSKKTISEDDFDPTS